MSCRLWHRWVVPDVTLRRRKYCERCGEVVENTERRRTRMGFNGEDEPLSVLELVMSCVGLLVMSAGLIAYSWWIL